MRRRTPTRQWPWWRVLLCLGWCWAFAPAAVAQAETPAEVPAVAASAAAEPEAGTVQLNQRRIAQLRASLLGDSPAERAELARMAIAAAAAASGPGVVTHTRTGDAVRFEVDGTTMFFLVPADVAGPRPGLGFEAMVADVQRRLQIAVREAREAREPRRIAAGIAMSLLATAVALVLLAGGVRLRRRAEAAIGARVQQWQARNPTVRALAPYSLHAGAAGRFGLGLLAWGLGLLVVDAWLAFVLHQFPYTRPWGERSSAWLLEVLQQFALAIAAAVPGLVTAALIFVLARLVVRANSALLRRVQAGELHLGWLDADTAEPTRRVANLVIWLFALAMAYPYLPGANSEAFKGVTVLAGLMLSLGASGVVGQALAGLSLAYARSLRVGEYVRIGETEGTVVSVGLLATRIHTGLGEEVSLPSAVVFGQPVRNFSRLVRDGQFMLHVGVTIGYATPWRQVHALLLEAARRTPGVASDPAPYVVQTALSDFYVEYRLCAQSNRHAPQRRAEAQTQLHANIQDVFNENGVQIMSPHYRSDPATVQVVPPGPWSSEADTRAAPVLPPGGPLNPSA
ncbi:MAG: mechanosensitive ion channel [Burkholderiales bacterium]|nr:mechanosensitive ion channel [Burkholderiales bacterium]